jgi:hypothetical protein
MVHIVHESFEDEWGNSYVEGDVVFEGILVWEAINK